MAKLKETIAEIIIEIEEFQKLPDPKIEKDDEFPLPRLIPAKGNKSLWISKKADQLISRLSQRLFENEPQLRSAFSQEEFRRFIRSSLGPILSQLNFTVDVSKNSEKTLRKIRTKIEEAKINLTTTREYCFGCTLFDNEQVLPFNIGPVSFEPKLIWLNKKINSGEISKISGRRIKKIWQGEKLTKRKDTWDNFHEEGILESLGTCPYICSLTTEGLAKEAGKEKALMIARLALTSIALIWATSSRALDGFNLWVDRTLRNESILVFENGKKIIPGKKLSHRPFGPWIESKELEATLSSKKSFFMVIGELMDLWITPQQDCRRPDLLNSLFLALLWFHEGCREKNNLIAIVKFAASLDTLAGGGKEGKILKLINTRLGIENGDVFLHDGTKMKEIIRKIYGQGRSMTIHGTNKGVSHDWVDTRSHAEWFARRCFISSIEWAAINPEANDIGDMLRK